MLILSVSDSRATGPASLQPLTSEPWPDLAPVSSMTGKLADFEPRLWGCEQGNSCTLQHELCTSTHGHLISIKEPLFHYLLTSPPWVKFFVNEALKHGVRVFSPPSYAQKIKSTTQLDRITLNVKEYKKNPKNINLDFMHLLNTVDIRYVLSSEWSVAITRAKYRNQAMFWGLSLKTSLFERIPTVIQPTATFNLT